MNLVYRTVHLPTGRFYLGRHITDDIDDGYFGSGSDPLLKDKKNLEREILHICDTPEEMIQLERELITEWINHPDCMNMIIGDISRGGVLQHSEESKRKIAEGTRKALSNPAIRKKISASLKGRSCPPVSDETRKKQSEWQKGVPKSEEFKKRVSKTLTGVPKAPSTRMKHCSTWKITDLETNEIMIVEDRVTWCEEREINYHSFNVMTRNKTPYKKKWICQKI